MVKIRLARIGAKNKPYYRVVVTDVRNARDGKFIERVGFLNMVSVRSCIKETVFLNLNRINYWVQKGAVLSLRVGVLIKNYKKKSIGLDRGSNVL